MVWVRGRRKRLGIVGFSGSGAGGGAGAVGADLVGEVDAAGGEEGGFGLGGGGLGDTGDDAEEERGGQLGELGGGLGVHESEDGQGGGEEAAEEVVGAASHGGPFTRVGWGGWPDVQGARVVVVRRGLPVSSRRARWAGVGGSWRR